MSDLEVVNEAKNKAIRRAEIAEKRIAELEDKLANADYQLEGRDIKIKEIEHQLTHRNCLDCSNHSSNLRMRNLELEKENAELKETLKTYNGCGDWDNDFHTCRVYLQHEELQMYIEELTKAKEIIKMLHSDCYSIAECEDTNIGLWEDDLAKAEQFLKDCEVEK